MSGLDALLTRLLRLPPPPEAPVGSPGSLRVVRACDRFVRYRQLVWIASHAGFGLFVLGAPVAIMVAAATGAVGDKPVPVWATVLLLALAAALVVGWLAFALVSLVTIDLDRRWRTYLFTDRSLRVREGLWVVREITLTFNNVQNVTVSQGPLERLFGLASVQVETAGGGGSAAAEAAAGGALGGHRAVLRGLDGAEALRDELVAAVRRARADGAGQGGAAAGGGRRAADAEAVTLARLQIEALREVALEARALRGALVAPIAPMGS